MISAVRRILPGVLAILTWECIAGHSWLFGQGTGNQHKADELIRSAQRMEILGYVLAGVGMLVMVAAIPYAIYYDRKKKARKQAKRAARQRDDAESSSR
jgi:hypothetical protein